MSHQESEKFIEEARLLLPWYLTNTLSDEEQALVNKALEASPELRKEFMREEKMMQLVKENTSLLELSALDTTEQRLENTLARIEREEQQSTVATAETAPAVKADVAGKDNWFSRLFTGKLFDIEWLTPANAAFASLLAVQVGVLGYHQLNQSDKVHIDHSNPDYSTVSTEQTTDKVSIKQRFLMEFHADAQHGEVCDFLTKLDAHIVKGPNSRNIFVVEMPTDPYTDAEALAGDIMAKASNDNDPVVFIGSEFKE